MGAILLLAGSLVPAAPTASLVPASLGGVELKRFEYQQILMGVPVKIVVYSAGEPLANSAVHAAFDRIRQLNLIFSDYDDDSEISRLCRTSRPGRPVSVSPELAFVLGYSLELSRRSEGAFDVTVGPLVSLWRKARRTKQLPSAESLAAAKERVGYQFVRLDERARTVELLKPGMRLDFGGIVKGYAADEARAVLKAKECPRALVGLAGDIAAGEPPPGQTGWRIGVQGIGSAEKPPDDYLLLTNKAVSTAGDMFQFVEVGGKRYSHLVDPKTGLGITRRISVTVVAPTGLVSDGLDSAAAILGPEKGLKLIESTSGAEGRIVELTKSGLKTTQTQGFAKDAEPITARTVKPTSQPGRTQ
jgi:FAD:protein FMN transferase